MTELLHEAIQWYNLPWTILLGLLLLYWIFEIVTGIDFDLDFDLDADLDAEGPEGVSGAGGPIAGLAKFVHLGHLPLMMIVTAIAIAGWAFSIFGNYYLNPGANAILGVAFAIIAFVPAVFVARLCLWPFVRFYKSLEGKTDGNESMIGRVCKIRTDRVDDRFGQAEVPTPEGPYVINVRLCSTSAPLSQGDTALIIAEDTARMSYTVRRISNEHLVATDPSVEG